MVGDDQVVRCGEPFDPRQPARDTEPAVKREQRRAAAAAQIANGGTGDLELVAVPGRCGRPSP
jgi:hypothetical protein